MQEYDIKALTPLSPIDFQVLLALRAAPLHGYGIMKAVEESSGGKVTIELGSLYRMIARMMSTGLIAEAENGSDTHHAGKTRRNYRITPLGLDVAQAEARRLHDTLLSAADLLTDGEAYP
jgi:DNA-binding PadR family transcriptional regulator